MLRKNENNQEFIKPLRLVFGPPSNAPGGQSEPLPPVETHEHGPGTHTHEHHPNREHFPGFNEAKDKARNNAVLNVATDKIAQREAEVVREKPFSHIQPYVKDVPKFASEKHLQDFLKGPANGGTDEIGQLWRLLPMVERMKYSLIRPRNWKTLKADPEAYQKALRDAQRRYLRSTGQYSEGKNIRTLLKREFDSRQKQYAERPALSKVPVVAVPTTPQGRAKLDTGGKRFFMFGSQLAENIANDKALASQAEYVNDYYEGTDNPVNAVEAIKKIPPEDLKGGVLTLNFGPQMFYNMELEQLKSATNELLDIAAQHDMKIIVGTPLHTYIGAASAQAHFGDPAKKDSAEKMMREYNNFIAENYQQRRLHALVGIGLGMTRSHLTGHDKAGKRIDVLNFYKSKTRPPNLSEGLNEEGTYHCASAMINGIMLALGKSPEVVTSAEGELNNFGAGVVYDPDTKKIVNDPKKASAILSKNPSIELIPGYEKRQTIANLDSPLKDYLWALGEISNHVGNNGDLAIGVLSMKCNNTRTLINEMESGAQKDFAMQQFLLLRASIYYGRAMTAAMSGNNKRSLELVNDAIRDNKEFLGPKYASDKNAKLFALRLRQLRDEMEEGYSYVGLEKRLHGKLIQPEQYTRLNLEIVPEKAKKEEKTP